MLALEDVSVTLGDFTLAGSLTVERGAHLSLIGPSGGGKSTVLNLIAGFVTPDRGAVRLDGREMTSAPPAERPVTMLFQEHNIFPHLDVAANVGLGLSPSLRLGAKDRERVAGALRQVGLDGFGARRPADLSGGQRQRVALARALLRDKPILLLDEPFAALGPALRVEMLALVATLRAERGLTVVMVTHAPADARRAGGVAALIAEGRIGAPGPVGAMLDDPPPELAAYLGD